jgi:hypothetical protein
MLRLFRIQEIWTMNDRLDPGMREASRLTRAGRLIQATALLQRMLQRRSSAYPASSTGSVPPAIALVPETVEATDSVPYVAAGQKFDAGARNWADRAGGAYLPEARAVSSTEFLVPASNPAWAR